MLTIGQTTKDSVNSDPVVFAWTFTGDGEWGTAHHFPLRGEEDEDVGAYVEFRFNVDDELEEATGEWFFETFVDGDSQSVSLMKGMWVHRTKALAAGSQKLVEFLRGATA